MQVKKIAGSSPIFKNIIFAFPSRPSRKCSRLRLWVVMPEEEKNKFQSETIEPTRPFYFRVFFTSKTKQKKRKKMHVQLYMSTITRAYLPAALKTERKWVARVRGARRRQHSSRDNKVTAGKGMEFRGLPLKVNSAA